MKHIIFLIAVSLSAITTAQQPVLNEDFWQVDGTVNAIEYDEAQNVIYVGGGFKYVGPTERHGASVNKTTGMVDFEFKNPNATVWTSIPDGNGGWYIGGDFTEVGGLPRNYIAQINALGEVTEWNPEANSTVRTLAISGSIIYAGGHFTSMGGQNRNYIAALDAETGSVTEWNPNANGQVYTLVLSDSTIFAGGLFLAISGQSRSRLAEVYLSTAMATDFNPGVINSRVRTIVLSDSIIYAGGDFTSFGGQNRSRLAAINIHTNEITGWNPHAWNAGIFEGFMISVWSLAIVNNTIYAGGSFTIMGGLSRPRIAAIDALTGIVTPWNPVADDAVHTIAVSESTVYAGGLFTSMGGQNRNRIAAVDIDTALPTDWNPGASISIRTISLSDTTIYVGGEFASIGGQSRRNIASFDATSGQVTSWNPVAFTGVSDLLLSGSTLFVGGHFTLIGGQNRDRIAAFDVNTGLLTDWNPGSPFVVSTMAVYDSKLYIGGSGLKAIDAVTGLDIDWNPSVNGEVWTLHISGSTLYAGGNFTSIGGESRNHLAAIDVFTGLVKEWNPNANDIVYALAASGSRVYAGGQFTAVGGESREGLVSLDAVSGEPNEWNPLANERIYSLAAAGSTVYAGGLFSTNGEETSHNFAAFNTATGLPTNWNPNPNIYILAIVITPNRLYLGGPIWTIENKKLSGFAAFDHISCLISASCSPVTLTLSPSGSATLNPEDVTQGSTVSCGTPIFSLSQTQFDCSHLGENFVIITVEDESGNTETCTAIVTVIDDLAPTITCPSPIEVYSDPGICGSEVNYITPSGMDNCADFVISPSAGMGSGALFPGGITTETYTITDVAGNTSSCSFTITVLDTIAPVAICTDINLFLDEDNTGTLTPEQVGGLTTDICGIASLQLNSDFFTDDDLGVQEVILTAVDSAGNSSTCAANIIVISSFGLCPSGNVVFNSQADVDAFNATYPYCAEIDGDLTIHQTDNPITDLTPLSGLQSVTGYLHISLMEENEIPTSLAGLENVVSVGGLIVGRWPDFGQQSRPMASLEPLSGISGTVEYLSLRNIASTSTGTNFENITTIDHLDFYNCPNLETLPTFPSLTSARMLAYESMGLSTIVIPPTITDIELTYPGQDSMDIRGIRIENNPNLQEITCQSIFNSCSHLEIYNNNNLEALSGFDSLHTISTSFILHGPHPSIFDSFHNVSTIKSAVFNYSSQAPLEITITLGQNHPELQLISENDDEESSGGLIIEAVHAQALHFPENLTSIDGSLYIYSIAATTVSGLENLEYIGGPVYLFLPGLSQFPDFTGLTSIGGDLKANTNMTFPGITDFTGFDNLQHIGGSLTLGSLSSNNSTLVSLNGLQNLNTIGENLIIHGLSLLADISAISGLQSIGGNFELEQLPVLNTETLTFQDLSSAELIKCRALPVATLPAFPSIQSLNNYSVQNNANLLSLTGIPALLAIDNLTISNNQTLTQLICNPEMQVGQFQLTNNINLSDCANPCLCSIIASASSTNISNNGDNCNSPAELTQACGLVNNVDSDPAQNILIYIDHSNTLHISSGSTSLSGTLHIHDLTGRLIHAHQNTQQNYFSIPFPDASTGIYLVSLTTPQGRKTQKIFKIP